MPRAGRDLWPVYYYAVFNLTNDHNLRMLEHDADKQYLEALFMAGVVTSSVQIIACEVSQKGYLLVVKNGSHAYALSNFMQRVMTTWSRHCGIHHGLRNKFWKDRFHVYELDPIHEPRAIVKAIDDGKIDFTSFMNVQASIINGIEDYLVNYYSDNSEEKV